MISRLVSPVVFPVVFCVFVWLIARRASPDHKVGAEINPWLFVALASTCLSYAKEWHGEIGLAWQNHPGFTALLTLFIGMLLSVAFKRLLEE